MKESKQPLVSILIPLYNAESYIAETIKSILHQSYTNIEIIIVDDDSKDASYDVAGKFSSNQIHLYRNPNKGANSARNYAFSKSNGEYVMFLDADDLISQYKIEKQVKSLLATENKMALSFTTLVSFINGEEPSLTKRFIDKDYANPCDLLIEMWETDEFNCPHCYMASRFLLAQSGGWNEDTIKNQDGEFFAKVISLANKIIFVPDEYALWRIVPNSVSHTFTYKTWASQLETYKTISNIILKNNNTVRARNACARNLAWWFFLGYPQNRSLLSEGYIMLHQWGETLEIPYKGRYFIIVKKIFGWRIATLLIKNRFLLKIIRR